MAERRYTRKTIEFLLFYNLQEVKRKTYGTLLYSDYLIPKNKKRKFFHNSTFRTQNKMFFLQEIVTNVTTYLTPTLTH